MTRPLLCRRDSRVNNVETPVQEVQCEILWTILLLYKNHVLHILFSRGFRRDAILKMFF
jgi:hypothetical protein